MKYDVDRIKHKLERLRPWVPPSRAFALICILAAFYFAVSGDAATAVVSLIPGLTTWISLKQYWTWQLIVDLAEPTNEAQVA